MAAIVAILAIRQRPVNWPNSAGGQAAREICYNYVTNVCIACQLGAE